jgi:hypothetical protein
MKTRAVALLVLALAAPAGAEPFADAVVSHTIGTGGGAIPMGSALPGVVLGPPRGGGAFLGTTDTLSLGLGGSIVLAFTDNVVIDGPGSDLTVFENPFLIRGVTTQPPYAEPGTVSVSADGVHWVSFPCAVDAPPYYPGCAGVYPVFANADDPAAPSPLVPSATPIADLVGVPVDTFTPPPGSGGDSFDLALVGLHAARFLRIDASQIDPRLAGLSGFDLDAVAAVNSLDTAGLPDADADGIPDAADDCPAVPDPAQRDTDHDGVGDACQGGGPPDGDGDGVPDATDDCPAVPNADQADADGDGIGDACDTTGGGHDPDADGDGVPDARDDCPTTPDPDQRDADGDGAGDACDPCPLDATCLPLGTPGFGCGGNQGPADALLTCLVPQAETTALPAGARTATVVVVIAPDVEPGTIRVRAGRRDLSAGAGDLTPGSTKTLTVPLGGRRTVVKLKAKGPRVGRKRLVDRDRLIFLVD